MRFTDKTLCFLLAAAAASFPVMADQVVYFVNGKAITVKTIEKGPKITVLEIEGGGRIGVPTLQIDRIEDLQVSPPQAAVSVTAIIPQPQPAAQPAGPTPAGPTQVAVGTPPAAQAAAAPQAPATGPGAGKAQANGNLPAPPALGVVSDPLDDGVPAGGPRLPGQGAGPQGAASRYNGAIGNQGALQRRPRANFGRGRPGAQPGAATYMPPPAAGQANPQQATGQPPAAQGAQGQAAGQPPAAQGNGQNSTPPPSSGSSGNGQQSAPPPSPPAQAEPQPPPEPDPGQNAPAADDAGSDGSQSSDGGSNPN